MLLNKRYRVMFTLPWTENAQNTLRRSFLAYYR